MEGHLTDSNASPDTESLGSSTVSAALAMITAYTSFELDFPQEYFSEKYDLNPCIRDEKLHPACHIVWLVLLIKEINVCFLTPI